MSRKYGMIVIGGNLLSALYSRRIFFFPGKRRTCSRFSPFSHATRAPIAERYSMTYNEIKRIVEQSNSRTNTANAFRKAFNIEPKPTLRKRRKA